MSGQALSAARPAGKAAKRASKLLSRSRMRSIERAPNQYSLKAVSTRSGPSAWAAERRQYSRALSASSVTRRIRECSSTASLGRVGIADVGTGIALGQAGQDGRERARTLDRARWSVADQAQASGLLYRLGRSAGSEPAREGLAVPGRGPIGEELGEPRERLGGRRAGVLEIEQAIVELLVDLEAEMEQRDQLIGRAVGGALVRVDTAGGFAGRLVRSPHGGPRSDALEQRDAAELADQIGAPPGQAWLVGVRGLAGVGDRELVGEDLVEVFGGEHDGRRGDGITRGDYGVCRRWKAPMDPPPSQQVSTDCVVLARAIAVRELE